MKPGILIVCIMTAYQLSGQSLITNGTIYRLKVPATGIYRIDARYFQEVGISLEGLSTSAFQLYGSDGGMLSQKVVDFAESDLKEIPLWIQGGEDGQFDPEDYILFFAEGADQLIYQEEARKFDYHKNLYDSCSYVFLKIDGNAGKRIAATPFQEVPVIGEINRYLGILHHENDLENLLQSGREWLGENLLDYPDGVEISVDQIQAFPGFRISASARVISRSGSPVVINFSFNNAPLGKLELPRLIRFAYGPQALEKTFNKEFLLDDTVCHLNFTLKIENEVNESIYLDYMQLQYSALMNFKGKQNLFWITPEGLSGWKRVIIQDETPGLVQVWDVTDPFQIKDLSTKKSGNSLTFNKLHQSATRIAVFNPAELPNPEWMGKLDQPDLKKSGAVDFLIVTHKNFLSEAEKLAEFRQSNDGLKSIAVTTEQIFNEFSSGRQDVTAIRNYILLLYKNYGLKYVLLFGDASYDFRNLTAGQQNTNFIPVYQSINSLHNVHSYGSDDFYGFMEDHEGAWPEKGFNLEDHTLDIGIGRIPVATVEEARLMASDPGVQNSLSSPMMGMTKNTSTNPITWLL